jgi:hypothetical protein
MSPIYDLSPANVTVNVAEDVRGSATPAPAVSVAATASVILPANSNRATAHVYNGGTTTIFLGEGTTVSTTAYNYPLPPGRLWEPDSNFRYLGAISAITASGTNAQIRVSESVVII